MRTALILLATVAICLASPPSAPVLTVTRNPNQIELRWTFNGEVEAFQVTRTGRNEPTFTRVIAPYKLRPMHIRATGVTSYTWSDSAAIPGVAYRYTVTAWIEATGATEPSNAVECR